MNTTTTSTATNASTAANTTTTTVRTRSTSRHIRRIGAGLLTGSITAGALVGVVDDGAAQAATPVDVELPDIAAFVQQFISGAPLDVMGRATGAELEREGIEAHLQPEREYYFLNLDSDGFHIDLPRIEGVDIELLPEAMSFPQGEEVLIVVDPTDPYFYVGGPCPEKPTDQRKGTGRKGAKREVKRAGAAIKRLAELALDGVQRLELVPSEIVGPECGFGMSINGNIPVDATIGGDDLTANLVVDAEVQVHPAVLVDGALFAGVGENRFRATATGDAELSVPFLDQLVELAIPLGEAEVDVQFAPERIGLAVEGDIAVQDSYEMPLLGVPLTLPANGGASVAMRLGAVPTASGWTIDPESFVQIDGQVGVGLGALGRATGLDLHDIAGAQVSARIDRTGARVTGRADLDIHPAVATGADAAFDLTIDATDFAKSRLAFDADVTVGGTRLAAADIQLSSAGLYVAGSTRLGGLAVDVAGRITPTGADIRGNASVQFSLDAINSIVAGARADIDTARREIRSIDSAIVNRRQVVRTERAARDRALQDAIAAVDTAKRKVDEINGTIAYNDRLISARQTWVRNEINRFSRLGWWQRTPWAYADHAAKLASWNTQIAAYQSANAAQRTLRDGAKLTLTGAQRLVSEIRTALQRANVDDDLEIRRLKDAKKFQTDVLNTLEAALRQVKVQGNVRGDIAVQVGTSGVGASLSARYCDGGRCTTLTGGRVRIGNPTTACVDVLGLGEVCIKL